MQRRRNRRRSSSWRTTDVYSFRGKSRWHKLRNNKQKPNAKGARQLSGKIRCDRRLSDNN
jgi:hypothetical protein